MFYMLHAKFYGSIFAAEKLYTYVTNLNMSIVNISLKVFYFTSYFKKLILLHNSR